MKPYMFVVDSIPLPENRNYNAIGGAKVHIWVIDEEQDRAELRAIDYIRSLLWDPLTIEYAFEISPEQIPLMHEDEAALYATALKTGIAADFLGWLKDAAPSDYPTMLWRP